MAKTCKKCGAQMEDNDKFCDSCGAEYTEDVVETQNTTEEIVSPTNIPQKIVNEKQEKQEKKADPNKIKWYLSFWFLAIISFISAGTISTVLGIIRVIKYKKKHLFWSILVLLWSVFVLWAVLLNPDSNSTDGSKNDKSGSTEIVADSASADEVTENVAKEEEVIEPTYAAEIGIKYTSGILTGASDNTEIKVYLDNEEIGKMNRGDTRVFVCGLTEGEHKIKTVRNMLDKDTYKFSIVAPSEDSIFPESYIGLKYSYSSLTSSGKLEEGDFPSAVDDDYVYLSSANGTSQNDGKIDLSGILDYGVATKKEASDYISSLGIEMSYVDEYGYYLSANQNVAVSEGDGGGYPTILLTDSEYSILGISCGDNYDEILSALQSLDVEQIDVSNIESISSNECFDVDGHLLALSENNGTIDHITVVVDGAEKIRALANSGETTEDEADYSESEDNYSEEESEYILPQSDTEYLSESDCNGLSADECKLARNEIYARHGRLFNDESLQEYFNNCSWYYGEISPEDFTDDMLSSVELDNLKVISAYETSMGYK